MTAPQKTEEGVGAAAGIFGIAFGAYLLFGAAMTVYTGKHFGGFPPQLDIAWFLFGASETGAYVEALLAAALGLACIAGSIFGMHVNAAKRAKENR